MMRLDLSTLRVDRASPVPLYFQIERLIEQEIRGGVAEPGDQLPSEPEMAELLGVSRSVIRQAITRLEQAGLLRRARGHGTFLTQWEHRRWLLQGADGFFLQEGGVTSQVLRAQTEPLPSWASDALALPRKSSGVVLERQPGNGHEPPTIGTGLGGPRFE
jgi:GntR family transcriptional regulator